MPPESIVRSAVWTHVEDQILKAGVQKYGPHRWSKIASLLPRKSARQCELRWKDHLDPGLRRDPWSKDEDARLIAFAKRMPNQWRTIADVLGRTAQQCTERYTILLSEGDQENTPLAETSVETQPAVSDSAEMHDEEREMLADARVRLLNTQGRKASRRIRERMLEESRIIAQIQRRRELKQAGIKTAGAGRPRKKNINAVDYGKDIPFEHLPPEGDFETTGERLENERALEDFERSVDLGLLKTKRSRIEDNSKPLVKKPKVVKDNILPHRNNEYDKPKLALSEPKIIVDSRPKSDISLIKELRQLFSQLPPPENEYSFTLDSDEDDNLNEIIGEESLEEKEMTIMLDSLMGHIVPKKRDKTLSALDQQFNELVELKEKCQAFEGPKDLLSRLTEIDQHIRTYMPDTSQEHPELNLGSEISDKDLNGILDSHIKEVRDLQDSLTYINVIANFNKDICDDVAEYKLDGIRRAQHHYYTVYKMYLAENKALELRASRLQKELEISK